MSVANSAEDTVVTAASSDFAPEPVPGLEHALVLEPVIEPEIVLVVEPEVELEASVVEAVAEYGAFAAADSADSAQPVGDAA